MPDPKSKEMWPVKHVKFITAVLNPAASTSVQEARSAEKQLRIEFDTVERMIVLTPLKQDGTPHDSRLPIRSPIGNVAYFS